MKDKTEPLLLHPLPLSFRSNRSVIPVLLSFKISPDHPSFSLGADDFAAASPQRARSLVDQSGRESVQKEESHSSITPPPRSFCALHLPHIFCATPINLVREQRQGPEIEQEKEMEEKEEGKVQCGVSRLHFSSCGCWSSYYAMHETRFRREGLPASRQRLASGD